MKDQDFLIYLHERLEHTLGVHPNVDYMHKLRAIIKDTPKDRLTQNWGTGNSLEELLRIINKPVK